MQNISIKELMLPENFVGIGYEKDSHHIIYTIEKCKELIREALLSAGLGAIENNKPFLDIINPGSTVLLKPNWVVHKNYSGLSKDSLITNQYFIEAVLIEVFKCGPKKIIIGDAPIQGCDFNELFEPSWIEHILSFAPCPIEIIDFRRTILKSVDNEIEFKKENARDSAHYILFDLKAKSMLEPVSLPSGKFRVVMYDSKLLNARHYPGTHQYLIAREAFDADVIINLPKLKTHRKAGLTGALKNIVGLNGNKEFLPHHRVGGSLSGGDCYQAKSKLKRISEYMFDKANRRIETRISKSFIKCACLVLGIAKKLGADDEMEGGWYGNDTIWRMTLDLNTILLYGKADGSMSMTKQRKLISLTDAIIAGDTEGPLSVEPVQLGMVTVASSSIFADMVHAALMGFDWKKIPTISKAFKCDDFPLTSFNPEDCEVFLNQKKICMQELREEYGKKFRAPKNWQGFIEIDRNSD
jgi:uncharacterized protein (DUF362 family)